MTLTILVPLDGSPLGEQAMPFAAALAQITPARLILLQAIPELANAAGYLEALAGPLRERGLPVETDVVEGRAAPAVVAEARRLGADLLVMASHGRGGLGRLLHGSTAEAVLAAAPAPVLLVRAGRPAPAPGQLGRGLRLVVPLDGSPFAEAALPAAAILAGALGGTIGLLRAVTREEVLGAPVLADEGHPLLSDEGQAALVWARARDYVRGVAARLEPATGPVEEEIRFGEPDEVILAAGEAHGRALVVMATHGYTGLRAAALGHVATSVLRKASAPLLLVRPPELTGPLTPERIAAEPAADVG